MENLPVEIIHVIFLKLEYTSFKSINTLCKYIDVNIYNNEIFWKKYLETISGKSIIIENDCITYKNLTNLLLLKHNSLSGIMIIPLKKLEIGNTI